MKQVNKVLLIPYSSSEDNDFFAKWVEFLKPIHHLTNKEQLVLAAILRYRNELSKDVSNEKILDELSLNMSARNKLKDILNISCQQLNYILGKMKDKSILSPSLKRNGRIDYYKINPNFIPNCNEECGDFKVLILFKSLDAAKGIKTSK
jgi:hypothetical protein